MITSVIFNEKGKTLQEILEEYLQESINTYK